MRIQQIALALVLASVAASPALADSVSVTTRSDGTVVVDGKPCRVVTTKEAMPGNQTSITTGPGGVSGSTSVSPGGSGSSSSVSAGTSSSAGGNASSASSSDCVIYRPEAK